MCSFADHIDIRPAGSDQIEFYVYVGLNLQSQSTVFSTKPFYFHLWADYRFTSHLPPPAPPLQYPIMRDDYDYDSDFDAVAWRSYTVASSKRVLFTFFHTHQMFTDDVWIFRMTPSQLGLERMGLMDFKSYRPLPLQGARSLETVKRQLMMASNGSVVCNRRHNIYEVVSDLGSLPGVYERYLPPVCKAPWTMEKGEVYTVVTFHRAMERSAGWISQHTVVYFYATPLDGETWEDQSDQAIQHTINQKKVM